jgi:hypothetical protein
VSVCVVSPTAVAQHKCKVTKFLVKICGHAEGNIYMYAGSQGFTLSSLFSFLATFYSNFLVAARSKSKILATQEDYFASDQKIRILFLLLSSRKPG